VDEQSQAKMGRNARRHGIAPGPLLGTAERCLIFAEPLARLIAEFKTSPRRRTEVRAAPGVPCAARPRAMTPSASRRRFSMSKDKLGLCAVCNNISDSEQCQFLSRPETAIPHVICVVEEPHNIVGIETTRQFNGRYHVLHGALSPLRGIGPESLKIKGLVQRIGEGEVAEVIVATNPTVEGEATAVLPVAIAQAAGRKGDAYRHGHSCRQRSGIRRRSNHLEGHGRPPRNVSGRCTKSCARAPPCSTPISQTFRTL